MRPQARTVPYVCSDSVPSCYKTKSSTGSHFGRIPYMERADDLPLWGSEERECINSSMAQA